MLVLTEARCGYCGARGADHVPQCPHSRVAYACLASGARRAAQAPPEELVQETKLARPEMTLGIAEVFSDEQLEQPDRVRGLDGKSRPATRPAIVAACPHCGKRHRHGQRSLECAMGPSKTPDRVVTGPATKTWALR